MEHLFIDKRGIAYRFDGIINREELSDAVTARFGYSFYWDNFKKGFGTPVFAPMDVPLHSENPQAVSYFSVLQMALLCAFHGTAGGKLPNTILIGPEKRVLSSDQVNINDIVHMWERYARPGVVHAVQKLDPKEHEGLSEKKMLARLAGVEKKTGGTMRFERNQLIMPSDVGLKSMNALDWAANLPRVLPPNTDVQDLRQALAHAIYCLEAAGWIPDYFDYDSPQTSRVNVVLRSFIPDEGVKGAVPVSSWGVRHKQFRAVKHLTEDPRDSAGVRAGIRMR